TAITVLARQQGAVNEGLVYDLDPAAALITLQAENGNLSSYRLAGQVSVIMAGQRFPTLGDLCRGDRVRVTVENYAVTTIEVLEIASRRDISGTVVAIASDSRVLTLEANGNLEAYRVTGTAEIIVPGLAKAVLADVVKGDEVQVRVEKGEIIRLEVRSREVGDKLTGTVVGVDTGNKIVTIKVENDELRAYRVKDNARIVVNGEEKSLSYVEKDMRASVRLVNGEIIFLDVDNSLAGTVVALDKEGRLLVIQDSEGGRETYVIAKNADVESRDDRDELGEIRKGDYVEITVEDDVVTAIKIRTAFILRVEDVREAWDRIDAEDEDGDNFRLYVRDGVELVVPGIDYPDVDDVQEGDIIKATYLGDDLEKVEVLEPRRGRVTEVNSYTRTVTVAYYDGTTAILEFNSNSEVIKDSTHYSSLSRLAAGDRVEVLENIEGGYTFKVMKVISGIL
ncbi:MAG: hypothetical protein H5T99_10855, partial [Moorella sp. (in: Bacteria)]|nr:hypothetical protein [Moorella sp. (in: firmicutes)]